MHPPTDQRRAAAARLFATGLTRAEVARRLGVSRATATRWFRKLGKGGPAALTAPRTLGRPPSLDAVTLATIQADLERPPMASGFALAQWSMAAIAALIERRCGVTYHRRHVARVLRRIGWVVLPFGAHAAHAFRRVGHRDPDGNALWLRSAAAGHSADGTGVQPAPR